MIQSLWCLFCLSFNEFSWISDDDASIVSFSSQTTILPLSNNRSAKLESLDRLKNLSKMDRKAELERKKAKLQALRDEKDRRRKEKEQKDLEDAKSGTAAPEKDTRK